MMSIAIPDDFHDVLSRIPEAGNDIIRNGSENRIIRFSSFNSAALINSSVRSRSLPSHYSICTMKNVTGCGQFSVLPISPVSFPVVQTRRPHSIQVSVLSNLNQPSTVSSCASNMIPSTSYLSGQRQSIQLFVKSIRNTTISIHIDPSSSISNLKHLIHAHDGIPPCYQRLMHRGRELREDALLSGLDVDGATVTSLLRVLGGNPSGQIPLYWWFGFSRSYQDGRAGEEGRICHVLSEIEFEDKHPASWFSDRPLSSWVGISLHSDYQIREIKMFACQATSLPESIGSLSSLKQLNASCHLLTRLPSSIVNLTSLTQLDVCNNKLSHLPDWIGSMTSLTELYITNNQLTCLPESICNLSSLQYFSFHTNQLTSVPDSIGEMRSLSYVYVGSNQLTSLPDSIGNLTNLIHFYASHNQLTHVPESIGNLIHLTHLNLGNNQLVIIPESIGNLASLSYLFLGRNELVSLPESITLLATLTDLYIHNNPFTSTPKRRNKAYKRYQRLGLNVFVVLD